MKACFISNKNEIELVLADGTRKPQRIHELKELLQTFTDSSHYITDGPAINVLEKYKKIALAYIEDDGTHWMIPEDAPYPAYSYRRKNFR